MRKPSPTWFFPLLALAPEQTAVKETELPPAADIRIETGIRGKAYELRFYEQPDGSTLLTSSAYPEFS